MGNKMTPDEMLGKVLEDIFGDMPDRCDPREETVETCKSIIALKDAVCAAPESYLQRLFEDPQKVKEKLKEYARIAQKAVYPEISPLLMMKEGVPFPIDKVTQMIFERSEDEKKIKVTLSEQCGDIIAWLEFMATDETKQQLEKLTPYDKRMLLAIGYLCENNHYQFTFAQLWETMGGKHSNLNKRQREQMKKSLRKLACTRIIARIPASDGIAELDFSLIAYSACEAVYKGQHVDAINISERPTWLEIAKMRDNQLTAIPIEAFSDGLSLTDRSIALSDYMLTQIAHMKNQKDFPRQMRLDKLAEKAGTAISDHKARQEFCGKVETKLSHFAKIGHISGFTQYANGYKINVNSKK